MNSIRSILIAIYVLAMLALSANLAAAAPQGPWQLPASSVSGQGNVGDPTVAFAPDGTTTVVWHQFMGNERLIFASTRSPGGAFGQPQALSAPNSYAFTPKISVGPDGTATVIWLRDDKGENDVIQARTRPPGGDFGPIVNVSSPDWGNALTYQISTGTNGQTAVVWSGDGPEFNVQASFRPSGGDFGAPMDISANDQDLRNEQVSVAPDGQATVIWADEVGPNIVVDSRTRSAGGVLGPITQVSGPTGRALDLRLTDAPSGATSAVWIERNADPSKSAIQVAVRPPGLSFGEPSEISDALTPKGSPNIAIAPNGTSTVVWSSKTGANTSRIEGSTNSNGVSYGQVFVLSPESDNSFAPRLAASPDGTTTVTWSTNGEKSRIYSRTRAPGGTFGDTSELGGSEGSFFTSQVASSSLGVITAVWTEGSGNDHFIKQATTSLPPTCETDPSLCPTPPKKFLPGVKNPTRTIAMFDGKRLHIRLKCPARFKPACLGKAVPVTLKSKKGKPMAAAKKTTIKSNRWKTTTFLIKPAYRNKIQAMTKFDKKLLFTKQLIRSKKIRSKKNQKTSTVFHVYKVRVKG